MIALSPLAEIYHGRYPIDSRDSDAKSVALTLDAIEKLLLLTISGTLIKRVSPSSLWVANTLSILSLIISFYRHSIYHFHPFTLYFLTNSVLKIQALHSNF